MTTIPQDVLDGKAPLAWMTESGVGRLYDVNSREVISISTNWSDSPECVPLYLKPQAMGWAEHKDFEGLWRVLFSGRAQTIEHRRSNDFVIVEHQVSGGRWLFTRDEFDIRFDLIDAKPLSPAVSDIPTEIVEAARHAIYPNDNDEVLLINVANAIMAERQRCLKLLHIRRDTWAARSAGDVYGADVAGFLARETDLLSQAIERGDHG